MPKTSGLAQTLNSKRCERRLQNLNKQTTSKKSYLYLEQQVGRQDKINLVNYVKHSHPIQKIVKTLGINRSTYYAKCNHKPSQIEIENANLTAESKQIYGAPKIHFILKKNHKTLSLKRVQKADIRSKAIKKWRAVGKQGPVIAHENLLKQDFTTTSPNQKWAQISLISIRHMTAELICQASWTFTPTRLLLGIWANE
jgi:hypothetical protein